MNHGARCSPNGQVCLIPLPRQLVSCRKKHSGQQSWSHGHSSLNWSDGHLVRHHSGHCLIRSDTYEYSQYEYGSSRATVQYCVMFKMLEGGLSGRLPNVWRTSEGDRSAELSTHALRFVLLRNISKSNRTFSHWGLPFPCTVSRH